MTKPESGKEYLELVVDEELIERAKKLGACREGLEEASAFVGKKVKDLPTRKYRNWATLFYPGLSINEDGHREYHNEKGLLSRDPADGPAFETLRGYKVFSVDGEYHNPYGAAIQHEFGTVGYWINGKRLTNQEFAKRKFNEQDTNERENDND